MKFADIGLSDKLLAAVADAGYEEPTPIQEQAIPSVLMMRDLIGIAQTGTGKTASFVLPMIDILAEGRSKARMPRSLILEPTRELAAQVAENFEKYGKNHQLSMALLIGGVSMGDQIKALEKGVDVLIATPGRLMDLFDRGNIMLNDCGLLVIDEADRMLDMGFIPDIESICDKLPAQRQTMLFSATMPPPIKKLSDKFLNNPKHIEVARPATASKLIEQFLIHVAPRKKEELLIQILDHGVDSAIVFCNRKTQVRDLNKKLRSIGFDSGEIHGDIDQTQRQAELEKFKKGEINILVASDVAARGIDVKDVSHVFNYDAPWHPDDYVHRIGRTGRAGAKGIAYTFATRGDAEAIDNIEKLIGGQIKVVKVAEKKSGGKDKSESKKSEDKKPEPKKSAPRGKAAPDKAEAGQEQDSKPHKKADDKPAKPARKSAKSEDGKKPAPKPSRKKSDDSGSEDGWNGPTPDFLSYGFKD